MSLIKEFAKIIHANNELLLNLINDILDMSKIEAGILDFLYTEVEINELIQTLWRSYRFKIKEGVEFRTELPAESYIIHTERNRLSQVLANFINNACKYTFEGMITIGYEIRTDDIYFFVTDTGKGLAEENISRVFDRFAKLDSFTQGTGLGLRGSFRGSRNGSGGRNRGNSSGRSGKRGKVGEHGACGQGRGGAVGVHNTEMIFAFINLEFSNAAFAHEVDQGFNFSQIHNVLRFRLALLPGRKAVRFCLNKPAVAVMQQEPASVDNL